MWDFLGVGGFIFVLGKVCFKSLGKLTPRQQNAPPTAFALESDIRAETGDGPFVRAARVLLSQAKMIVEAQVGQHDEVPGDSVQSSNINAWLKNRRNLAWSHTVPANSAREDH
jgi:hypothetical protein